MEVEEVLGRLRVDEVGCGSVEGGMVGCRGCDWRIRVCVCGESLREMWNKLRESVCVEVARRCTEEPCGGGAEEGAAGERIKGDRGKGRASSRGGRGVQ